MPVAKTPQINTQVWTHVSIKRRKAKNALKNWELVDWLKAPWEIT